MIAQIKKKDLFFSSVPDICCRVLYLATGEEGGRREGLVRCRQVLKFEEFFRNYELNLTSMSWTKYHSMRWAMATICWVTVRLWVCGYSAQLRWSFNSSQSHLSPRFVVNDFTFTYMWCPYWVVQKTHIQRWICLAFCLSTPSSSGCSLEMLKQVNQKAVSHCYRFASLSSDFPL